MTQGPGGKTMTYDGENRPLSVTHAGQTTSYIYAPDGTRLKKSVNGGPETLFQGGVEVHAPGTAAERIISYPMRFGIPPNHYRFSRSSEARGRENRYKSCQSA